jgi:pSer/pThr/pTyr-binding forkhead associated (FHA) protein
MTLVLQGIKLNDESLSQPLIGRFDERGGTLGRSDNATFTLPDPERLISRVQAQILFGDEGYWVEHVSTANSTFHNGRPLSAGMRVLLSEGDELRIGGYTLIAAFESDETSATVLRGRTVIMPPAGPPTRPRAALELGAAPTEATRNFGPGAPADESRKTPTNGSEQLQGFLQGEMGALLTGSMRSALESVLERFTATAAEREAAQAEFRRLLDQALRQAYDAQVNSK